MKINSIQLRKFLFKTTQCGYGNPDTQIEQALDGANVIDFQEGDWRMLDTYYGGQPYAGQEVIYYRDTAVWAMQYRGWLLSIELPTSQIYNFLRKALLAAPAEYPYREPKELIQDDLVYRNQWRGDIDNFEGEEAIILNSQEIYKGAYFGGNVDQ